MRTNAGNRWTRAASQAARCTAAALSLAACTAHAEPLARSAVLPPLRLAGVLEQTATTPAPTSATDDGTDWATHRRYVGPVLLSALVPGTGEMVTGHFWRGLPLLAIDVATWFGYAHYQAEGRDSRARYEQYADTHWNYRTWMDSLSTHYGDTQPNENLRWYAPLSGERDSCTCAFVYKEEDRQHYYENVGKYRFFWMGWDDWSYNTADPVNSDSAHHRREYNDIRIESNDNFDHATSLLFVAMATRLVSVVQTVFLVRSDLRSESLTFEPRMLPGRGTGFALTYRH